MENLKNIISLSGLGLDIVGVSILWYDSKIVITQIVNLLKILNERSGVWNDDPIEEKKMKKFISAVEFSSKINLRGFLLLVVGFVLQFIAYFL